MSQRLYVATRKGLFTFARKRRSAAGPGWAVERVSFLGDPVSMCLHDARDGALYAGLNLGHFGCKMHRSEDGGATWREVAAPSYASVAPPQPPAPPPGAGPPPKPIGPSLELIWSLESAGDDRPGELWCGTIPGGLFLSRDRGESWELVRSLWDRPERAKWFGGGYDKPGIHSVIVDPRDTRHVTVGVSCGGVWETRDGGANWACRADGMFAEYMPPDSRNDPNIQDPHRVVACPAAPDAMWTQHHNGVFRTTDGGRRWREVPNVTPAVFGFAVAVHPHDPQTAWFVPAVKDERRVPVEGKLVVARTRDGGETFKALRKGLPQRHAYDIVYRHALDVDASGERLAMGSTTGGLWTTEDGGDSWAASPERLPPVYCVRFAASNGSPPATGKAPRRRAVAPGPRSSRSRRR